MSQATLPPIPKFQATTIADREMQARGLAEDFMIRTVTFVRAPQIADSFCHRLSSMIYGHQHAPEFRIDMRGAVTFREGDARRN